MDDLNDSDDLESIEQDDSSDDFAFLKPSLNLTGDSPDSPGLLCEVKLYEGRYNTRGERIALQVGKHRDKEPQTHRDKDSALVFTRWYKTDNEIDTTELVIRSPYLKHALKEVIKEYPGIHVKTGNIVIRDLPKCLFHYREELQAFGLTLAHDSLHFKHLVLLLRHMWEQLESQCDSYYNLMNSPAIAPGLEFENLWMAFRPGDYLYTKVLGQHRVVKMKEMRRGYKRLIVEFFYISNDGEKVGYITEDCEIEGYDGYCPLTSLKIYPLEYHLEKEAIRNHAITRGKRMMDLRGVHYQMYKGRIEALASTRRGTFLGQLDFFPLQTTTIKSRVMVDAKTFRSVNPNNMREIDEAVGKLPKFPGTEEYDLSEDHLMICDHQVAGFSLADKQWCWLEVDKLVGVEFNMEAFDRLLLPQEQKDMIHSLVEVHTNDKLSFDDIIKGKGKGMVFLLHGVPGVGKTLTAESVADQTRRPLYTVSCGELGVEPSTVERKLKAALDLATTWNAIVLIDEADIFLEQRSLHDLERNSLVSIFLRLLEYYEGIMILTTNRVEAFDEAFKSRIHLAIKFHALTNEYRSNLWYSFIASTAAPVISDWLTGDTILHEYPWLTQEYLAEIGREELNGRQIKNTVRTALALAVSAGVELAPAHINTSLRAMKMFEADFSDRSKGVDEPTAKRRRI